MELLGVVEREERDRCDWLVVVGVRPELARKNLRRRPVVIEVPDGGVAHGEIVGLVPRTSAHPIAKLAAMVKGNWQTSILGASVYLADTAEAVPA